MAALAVPGFRGPGEQARAAAGPARGYLRETHALRLLALPDQHAQRGVRGLLLALLLAVRADGWEPAAPDFGLVDEPAAGEAGGKDQPLTLAAVQRLVLPERRPMRPARGPVPRMAVSEAASPARDVRGS